MKTGKKEKIITFQEVLFKSNFKQFKNVKYKDKQAWKLKKKKDNLIIFLKI